MATATNPRNTSANELIVICAADMEETEREIKVKIRHNAIIFTDAPFYVIELGRINSPEKVLGWILHLSDKMWVTKETLHDLTKVVSDHFKFKVHGM